MERILVRFFWVGLNFLKEMFFSWSFNERNGKLVVVKLEVVLDKVMLRLEWKRME